MSVRGGKGFDCIFGIGSDGAWDLGINRTQGMEYHRRNGISSFAAASNVRLYIF